MKYYVILKQNCSNYYILFSTVVYTNKERAEQALKEYAKTQPRTSYYKCAGNNNYYTAGEETFEIRELGVIEGGPDES